MPIDLSKYPPNWKDIRRKLLERADYRCEGSPGYPLCRAENNEPHPETGTMVVLTIGHLDNNPMNCDGMENGATAPLPLIQSNLRAWCQRCHLNYDAKFHAANAARSRRQKRKAAGQLSFFLND